MANDQVVGYDDLSDLRKKINDLEYKEIKPLKDTLTEVRIEVSNNSLLTQQAIENSKKLSETMDSVKEAMIRISESVNNTNKIYTDLSDNVDELTNKVDNLDEKVEKRIDNIEDKGKFDIIGYIKNNFITIIMFAGAIIYIYAKG